MSQVLLSICIPAYNRPEGLRDCLATVLPQMARFGGAVECIVGDDASPTDLSAVVAEARRLGPCRHERNERNLGCQANFVRLTTELAQGEYVWLLGDDDTLKAGGLDRVLEAVVRGRDAVDLWVLNYDHIDEKLRPGCDGLIGGVPEMGAEPVRHSVQGGLRRVEDLFDGEGGAFTPMYTLVTRRRLWKEYAARHAPGTTFGSVYWTYPHAVLVAESLVQRPVGYVAEPVLTLFDVPMDRFWWGRQAPFILTVRFLELLRVFERHGVPRKALHAEYAVAADRVGRLLPLLLWSRRHTGGVHVAARLFRLLAGHRRQFLRDLRGACQGDDAPAAVRRLVAVMTRCKLSMWKVLGRPHSA